MATIIMQTDFGREPSSKLEIKGVMDKRNLAYLLYELSFLPNISAIEERLNKINTKHTNTKQKHKTLKEKDQSKLIQADKIQIELKEIYEKIKKEYKTKTKSYKNGMDAMDWVPEENDFLKYFKFWLRKYADDLIESE
jgi:hypothetical protein